MKKHIGLIAVVICTLTILLVIGLGYGRIGSNPEDILSKYLDASLHGRYEKAYQYISAKDKAVKSLQEYLSEGEGEVPFFVHILASKVSYEIKEVTVTGNQVKVNVEFTEPDLEAMFMGMLDIAFMSAFGEETDEKRDEKMEKMLAEKFKGKDIPMTTRTQSFDLVKEVDGWKVFLDWETEKKEAEKERKVRALLSEAAELKKQKKLHEALKKYDEILDLGAEEVDAVLALLKWSGVKGKRDELQKEIKVFEEKQIYIDKVKITKLEVAEARLGGLGVFGEIKNLGNRTLKKVEITIYFLDKNGKPIFEETYYPVSIYSKPLKPNYVRKFGYRTDDVPSDWAGKAQARITNIEFQEKCDDEALDLGTEKVDAALEIRDEPQKEVIAFEEKQETEKKEVEKERKVRALLSEAAELKKQKKLHEALKKYDEILDLGSEEVDAVLALLKWSGVKGKRDELQKEIKTFEEKRSYIKYVELKEFRVEEGGRTIFGELKPRIFGKIVNNGNRTLKKVEVTVYFLGKDGRPIFEEDYWPIADWCWWSDTKPLKPGYIEEFSYAVGDDVPSDWAKKVRAKITDIEFE